MSRESNLKGVSRVFERCVREVLMVFQGGFKDVSKKFEECFKKILKSFKVFSRKIEGGVSREFSVGFKDI